MMRTRPSNQKTKVCKVLFKCVIISFNMSTILHIGPQADEDVESQISNHRGTTQLDMCRTLQDKIPAEVELWFGEFPVTLDKTVKDFADWDCMEEIAHWFRMRPNDLPTSEPLKNWFRWFPLGRGRRVKDIETWQNIDVERGLWFDTRPRLAKLIPSRFGVPFKIVSILTI